MRRRNLFTLAAGASLITSVAIWSYWYVNAPPASVYGTDSYFLGGYMNYGMDGVEGTRLHVYVRPCAYCGPPMFRVQGPFYYFVIAGALAPWLPVGFVSSRSWAKHRATARIGRCTRCGYDMRATPDRCPECGTAAVAKR